MNPPTQYVRVDWTDAAYSEDEDTGLIRGQVVGYLVRETDDMIVAALEWFEDNTFRRFLAIPKGCIQSIDYLDGA